MVDIDIRANIDRIVLKHVNHVLRITFQIMQGCLECTETAFQSFDKENTHNIRELPRNTVCTDVAALIFAFVFRRLEV